jgi:hypothetical protein
MPRQTIPRKAQTQSRVAREPIPLSERLGYSPAEFASLFGRSPTWGYRQIYSGRVKPIADCGRIIIPRVEVESVLARRREYNPAQQSCFEGALEPGTPDPAREAGYVRNQARFDKIATASTRTRCAAVTIGGKQ